MWSFIKKHFGEIIGWIIGVAGIVATIVCTIATERDDFFMLYVIALSLETILTVISIWHCIIKYSYEKKIDKLTIDAENKDKRIQELEEVSEKARTDEYTKCTKSISTIISNLKNASKLNNDLCNRIPEINEASYATLDTLQQGAIEDEELIKKELSRACNDFANALYDLYKRYTSNLLSYIVNMMVAHLKISNHTNKISVSVKLFDKPLNSSDDHNKVRVFTAFRDKQTYDEHEREIGEELYTIRGNVDFGCCLQKEQYIMNNTTKDSESYLNEHVDFDKYYNCAVVVPIRTKQVDSSYDYFGYVCCDCLNDNEDEVFDKESAQLLFSMAQLYSTFLETLNSNWYERIRNLPDSPKSFLSIIYTQTYKGKRR